MFSAGSPALPSVLTAGGRGRSSPWDGVESSLLGWVLGHQPRALLLVLWLLLSLHVRGHSRLPGLKEGEGGDLCLSGLRVL